MEYLIIGILVAMGLIGFIMGASAALSDERKAKKFVEGQRYEISQYVQANWPDEHASYRVGHSTGYQQGVLQSPELTREDDENTA